MPLELDPQLTFESLVVGSGNRLAYAAARRVAEAPGTSYNPLFIYSASGLGKTHLLHGIGHHARSLHPDLNLVYDTLESFVARVTEAFQKGRDDEFRAQLASNTMLLLDDVQFLAGQHRMQEELLRAWDQVATAGGQVVLTSDRPPPEIDALDQRLLSRFSGGLIMDVAAPDYETRVAIVRRTAERRGQNLAEGVAEALARTAFGNVRELQGGLNRVLAVQELEGRSVGSDEVAALLGGMGARSTVSEFDSFLADITETVTDVVAEPAGERQLSDAVERWRADGYRTRRLEQAIAAGQLDDAETLIRGFEKAVERLREIAGEIATLEPTAPELKNLDVLRDVDRVPEADALLADVRARNRPLPAPPAGDELEDLPLPEDQIAVKAVHAIARKPASSYNPLFLYGPEHDGRSALLAAAARRLLRDHPDLSVAYLRGADFAEELIHALEKNEVESWRSRWRRANALFVDGVEALEHTERAQEELFHLFDALLASGAQLVFGANRAPGELSGLEDRLRSRLEAGLVTVVTAAPEAGTAAPPVAPVVPIETLELSARPETAAGEGVAGAEALDDATGTPTRVPTSGADRRPGKAAGADAARDASPAKPAETVTPMRGGRDDWFRSTEKLLAAWPYSADWVVEELD